MVSQTKAVGEQRRELLVGDWRNSGEVCPGPFGPGGPVTGETTYHWGVAGKWLPYTSRLELPWLGAYQVHGAVAYNGQTGQYDAYAVNSLGNLLVYDGEWTDRAFTMASERESDDGTLVAYFQTGFARA